MKGLDPVLALANVGNETPTWEMALSIADVYLPVLVVGLLFYRRKVRHARTQLHSLHATTLRRQLDGPPVSRGTEDAEPSER